MKKREIILIIVSVIIYFIVIPGLLLFVISLGFNDKYDYTTDLSKYNDVIGINAKGSYQDKWSMSEEIFPSNLSNKDVKDFKMVYYDPWDKQFLSYLVIDYDDEDYLKEKERLKNYNSTKYLGYYNVTGFSNYDLLAMYADSYNGFVYAITNNDNTIIYVELIFCNYFYDIDYKEYIPNEYLPDGFDAKLDNDYQKKMMEE